MSSCSTLSESSSYSVVSPSRQHLPANKKARKHVSFNKLVYIVLIPTAAEFRKACLLASIWYSQLEINTIHDDILQEISDSPHLLVGRNPAAQFKFIMRDYIQELLVRCDSSVPMLDVSDQHSSSSD